MLNGLRAGKVRADFAIAIAPGLETLIVHAWHPSPGGPLDPPRTLCGIRQAMVTNDVPFWSIAPEHLCVVCDSIVTTDYTDHDAS